MAWCRLGFCLVLGFGASALSANSSLRVLSWGGAYQDIQKNLIFQPYTSKMGTAITDFTYHGNLAEIAAQAESPRYDVVQVEAQDLIKGCKLGYFEKINWHKLGGRLHFEPGCTHDCGVASILWSVALVYHAQKVGALKRPPEWRDFFDCVTYKGKRLLRKTPEFTLEIALLSDGVMPSSVYPLLKTQSGIRRALDRLALFLPNIMWWEEPGEALQKMRTENVIFAALYNGTFQSAAATLPEYRLSFRRQMMTKDYWAITKRSPEIKRAHGFLAFATSPEVGADLALKTFYAPSNRGAVKLMSSAEKSQLLTGAQNSVGYFNFNAAFWAKEGDGARKAFYAWLEGQSGVKQNALLKGLLEGHPLHMLG